MHDSRTADDDHCPLRRRHDGDQISSLFDLFLQKAHAGVYSVSGAGHGLPELLAIAVTAALHLKKGQMLLSIAGGTVCYMLLVQLVF